MMVTNRIEKPVDAYFAKSEDMFNNIFVLYKLDVNQNQISTLREYP